MAKALSFMRLGPGNSEGFVSKYLFRLVFFSLSLCPLISRAAERIHCRQIDQTAFLAIDDASHRAQLSQALQDTCLAFSQVQRLEFSPDSVAAKESVEHYEKVLLGLSNSTYPLLGVYGKRMAWSEVSRGFDQNVVALGNALGEQEQFRELKFAVASELTRAWFERFAGGISISKRLARQSEARSQEIQGGEQSQDLTLALGMIAAPVSQAPSWVQRLKFLSSVTEVAKQAVQRLSHWPGSLGLMGLGAGALVNSFTHAQQFKVARERMRFPTPPALLLGYFRPEDSGVDLALLETQVKQWASHQDEAHLRRAYRAAQGQQVAAGAFAAGTLAAQSRYLMAAPRFAFAIRVASFFSLWSPQGFAAFQALSMGLERLARFQTRQEVKDRLREVLRRSKGDEDLLAADFLGLSFQLRELNPDLSRAQEALYDRDLLWSHLPFIEHPQARNEESFQEFRSSFVPQIAGKQTFHLQRASLCALAESSGRNPSQGDEVVRKFLTAARDMSIDEVQTWLRALAQGDQALMEEVRTLVSEEIGDLQFEPLAQLEQILDRILVSSTRLVIQSFAVQEIESPEGVDIWTSVALGLFFSDGQSDQMADELQCEYLPLISEK